MTMLALAVLVPQERVTVVQKHIVHGRERVVYHLYLVDVPVYALMPFAFLRQGTSLSPQRGGLCEAHIIPINENPIQLREVGKEAKNTRKRERTPRPRRKPPPGAPSSLA